MGVPECETCQRVKATYVFRSNHLSVSPFLAYCFGRATYVTFLLCFYLQDETTPFEAWNGYLAALCLDLADAEFLL